MFSSLFIVLLLLTTFFQLIHTQASEMMSKMKPEDMLRIQQMATSMGMAPGMPGAPPTLRTATEGVAPHAAASSAMAGITPEMASQVSASDLGGSLLP